MKIATFLITIFGFALLGCTTSSIQLMGTKVDQDTTPSTFVSRESSLVVLGDSKDFDAFATSKPNVIVDFYADWCGPCRTLGATLRKAEPDAAEHNTLILKVNVDHHPEIAKRFQVAALPTVVQIKNGKFGQSHVGLLSANRLKELIRN